MTTAGISSKGLNVGGNDPDCGYPNKKGFNGNEIQQKEFSDGTGLDVYDFNARSYDPQIDRFIQIDPLTEGGNQESLSPYQFGLNNPIRYEDADGRCPLCPFIVWGWRAYRAYRTYQAVERIRKTFKNKY